MTRNAAALKSAALLLLADAAASAAHYETTFGRESAAYLDAMKEVSVMIGKAVTYRADRDECVDTVWAAWWEEQDRLGVPRTVRR